MSNATTLDLRRISTGELTDLISAAQIELASRNRSGLRRIAIKYPAYNHRRYGRPWIARVAVWPVGGSPELEFGSYCGDKNGGEVEILARPGDIIRDGQRDGRKAEGTISDWSVVEADYSLREISQAEARKRYQELQRRWAYREIAP